MLQKLFLGLILFIHLSYSSKAQFLNDSQAKKNVSLALDHLYNYEFVEAEKYFKGTKDKYQDHPVSHLIRAIQLEWEKYPIESNPINNKLYIKELNKCIELSIKLKNTKEYFPEATFFLLASHGFIALNLHQQGEKIKAALEAKKAYSYFKEGQKLYEKNPEFYFTTGMYNYYREQYPISHPSTKALFMFFDKGNKKLGIQQMEKAAAIALFTKTTATQYLSHVHIKYEENFTEALKSNSTLSKKFPKNKLYKILYIENLLYLKQYKTAEAELILLKDSNEKYVQLAYHTFLGHLNQFYTKNDQLASNFYAKALQITVNSDNFNTYKALAYKGLGEIFIKNKEFAKAKMFLNQAKENSEYEWMRRDIIKELNSI